MKLHLNLTMNLPSRWRVPNEYRSMHSAQRIHERLWKTRVLDTSLSPSVPKSVLMIWDTGSFLEEKCVDYLLLRSDKYWATQKKTKKLVDKRILKFTYLEHKSPSHVRKDIRTNIGTYEDQTCTNYFVWLSRYSSILFFKLKY